MNIRIHWVIGTAILIMVAALPLWFWYDGYSKTSWLLFTSIGVLAGAALGMLIYQRIQRVIERFEANHPTDATGPAQEIPVDIYCPKCAYDLRGAEGERCSECGYSLTGLRAVESNIPWVHRKQRGWWHAYWATVWLVTFRHRRFCEEYARTVSYPDARKFQRTTVVLLSTLTMVALVITYLTILVYIYQGWATEEFFNLKLFLEIWPIVIYFGGYVLFLIAVSGVPSYFFHPKHLPLARQNSAIAMSYYAGAPLIFSIVPTIFWIALFGHGIQCWHGVLLAWLAAITSYALMLFALSTQARLATRLMPNLKVRLWIMLMGLQFLWLVIGLITLVLLPLTIFYVMVIIASLV